MREEMEPRGREVFGGRGKGLGGGIIKKDNDQ